MIDYKELIDSIRKERVVLFLGSGFSRKAGAPMASDISSVLYNDFSNDIKEDLKEHKSLDTISEEYVQIFGRDALIEKLEQIMAFMPTDTSDHTSLAKVPHFHHIITTNYDTLIEDAYGADNCYVVRTTDDLVNLPPNKTIIYKIHGDFSAKEKILLTKQDYINFFDKNNEPLLWKYIQSQILTNDVLFIGYSLEDSNVFSIIQEIRRNVNNDKRRYFLIAPKLKHHKIERLARTRITYYDAKAEDLFPVLFETLDKNIKSDYQKKRISYETFSRYCMQHYLHPIVKEGLDTNKIIKFDSDRQNEVKINVTGLSKDIIEMIQARDTYKYNSFLPDTHIPALKISSEMMKGMNISMNGLTIADKEDYPNLFIFPKVDKIITSISVPSRKFKERVEFQKYKANKEQVCLLLETEAYTMKLIFSFLSKNVMNCTCNINSKDIINDIGNALKWMELLIALWSGEEVIITKYSQIPLKFPINNEKELNFFKRVKKYFENIQEIEDLYDVEFDNVKTFSEELYNVSELLIHSYHEHILKEKLHNQEYIVDVGVEQEGIWDSLQVGSEKCSFAFTQCAQQKIEFNGHNFELKHKNTIIPSCLILDVSRVEEKVAQIKFKVTSEYVWVKYTNQDILELPDFKKFKKIS